jgi:hypothetical protein
MIDGVSGINTLQVETSKPDVDEPAIDGTIHAGLSGFALRDLCRAFVRDLVALRKNLQASFEIVASGGVMNAEDAAALYSLGADCVMTTTAANFNPRLARECLELHARGDGFTPHSPGERFDASQMLDRVKAEIAQIPHVSYGQLLLESRLSVGTLDEALATLVARSEVLRERHDLPQADTFSLAN